MTKPTRKQPSQGQLLMPLLDLIAEAGGSIKAKDAADAAAEKLGMSHTDRDRMARTPGGKSYNIWDRSVRWTNQLAKFRGLTEGQGTWHLTDLADDKIKRATPGIVVTLFETRNGSVLWAEAETIESQLLSASINCIVTSPPYPLNREKSYGNMQEPEHVAWLTERARAWYDCLTDDGSLFLNLGDTWVAGTPTQSLYQERLLIKLSDLGYHLAQRLHWHNPSKLPAPAEWVTIRRIRLTPTVESILWLSKTPHPKASNLEILTDYSQAMRRTLKRGGTNAGIRPSGHSMAEDAFSKDNGGAIAKSLIVASNTASNDPYQRHCRNTGINAHPARFPDAIPELAIRLTTEPDDIVFDPFGGSLTTAAVAERLGRRWITTDRDRSFLEAGLSRFDQKIPLRDEQTPRATA